MTLRHSAAVIIALDLVIACVIADNMRSRAEAAPADDDIANDLAAVQLARDYGISQQEALTRIERQPNIYALDNALQRNVAGYAGTWIDQVNGGVAIIQLTKAADESAVNSYIDQFNLSGYAAMRAVDVNLATLQSTYGKINAGLDTIESATNLNLGASIDIANNRVAVVIDETSGMTPSEQAWYQGLLNGGAPVELQQGAVGAAASGCSFPSCNAPLRGGLWVSISNAGDQYGIGYCSSGFNVRSNSDGKNYTTTAGHCNSHTWYEKQIADGAFHTIGPTHNAIFNDSSDEAITTVNNPSGWQLPNNYVYVTPSYGTIPTTLNERYTITSETSGYVTGIYVCHTGATSGTNCGHITSSSYTFPYGGHTVHGLYQVAGTSCQGDSGGPTYIGHSAFGIYVAYPYTDLDEELGPNGIYQQCSHAYWYVEPEPTLEAALHVYTVLT
jgi:hypothetical protein